MKLRLSLFLLPLFLTFARADGTVVVQETFEEKDSATVQATGKGQSVSWSSDTTGSIQVLDDPKLASGKAFKGRKIVGILPFMMMSGPGDTITVHFSFRLAGPIANTDHGFRLGLFEGGDPTNPWFVAPGTGYRWNISTGPYPLLTTLAKESGGSGQKILSGQDTTIIDQSAAPFTLDNTAKHTATIILHMGDMGLHLSLAIDGKVLLQSDDLLAPGTLSPNCFAIRSDANTFLFDDFTVETDMQSHTNAD